MKIRIRRYSEVDRDFHHRLKGMVDMNRKIGAIALGRIKPVAGEGKKK